MTSYLDNLVLAKLSGSTYRAIKPFLNTIRFISGERLVDNGSHVARVYFPHSGILSSTVAMEDGHVILTGMIGRDGAFGAGPALDSQISLTDVSVLIEGQGSVVEASRFKRLAREQPELQELVIRSEQFFLSQVQRTAACNALHLAEQRVCTMLLRLFDLVGAEFELTQERLAELMGLRRISFSAVAARLQKIGAISYRRGLITIRDPTKLRDDACECSAAIQEHRELLFPQTEAGFRSASHDRKTEPKRAFQPGATVRGG